MKHRISQANRYSLNPRGALNRRQFLGGALTAAVSAASLTALPSLVAQNTSPESKPPDFQRKVKLGVIGNGGRGAWIAKLLQRTALSALVALAVALGVCRAGDSGALAWKTNQDWVALVQGERVVWQFHFGTNDTKPCFYPVALPEGPDLVWHRPPDHPWHLGLWFSWKFPCRENEVQDTACAPKRGQCPIAPQQTICEMGSDTS